MKILVKKRLEENSIPVTETGCRVWIKNCRKGYGRMRVNGKSYGAHRLSYIVYKGDIPEGLFVCHRCDISECINPDHLFLGTNSDNMKDLVKKGKHKAPKGIKNGQAKLTEDNVIRIKTLLKETFRSQADIAYEFHISRSLIELIHLGKRWRHVTI